MMRNQPWYFDGIRVAAIFFSFLLCPLFYLSSFCVLSAMLPVSLGCPFVIVPSVFSNVYLWIGSKTFKRGG